MRHDSDRGGDPYPRAPSQEEWDALSPEEQARVYAELPGKVTDEEVEHRLAEETRLRQEESRRREEAERQLKLLKAELARLKARPAVPAPRR